MSTKDYLYVFGGALTIWHLNNYVFMKSIERNSLNNP